MSDGPHVLLIEARFYAAIADMLVAGAVAEIERAGASYERVAVPGVFEIPGALRMAIKSLELVGMRRRFDAYVALGCVIRGETTHYDLICQEATRGIGQLILDHTLAVGFGVLTCESIEQAQARAAPEGRNKGGEAARVALHMIELKRRLGYHPR